MDLQRLVAPHPVIGEHQINIDRKPRHIGDEKVDRGAAFHRKRAAVEDRRCGLDQQSNQIDVTLFPHGFRMSVRPPLTRATQRLVPMRFPAALRASAAHGKESSSAHERQRRNAFCCPQAFNSVPRTSVRKERAASMISRASSISW